MSAISHLQAIRAGRRAVENYRRQIRRLSAEARALENEREGIDQEGEAALRALAEAALPDLSETVVAAVAEACDLPTLNPRPVAIAAQTKRFQTRYAAIENEARFRDRDRLVHPESGSLNRELHRLEDDGRGLLRALAVYDDPRFFWLRRRAIHEHRSLGAFQSFWRNITLAAKRERKALAGLLAATGQPSFQDCLDEYENLIRDRGRRREQHAEALAARQEVLDLIAEHKELKPWVDNPASAALDQLRAELAAQLANADLPHIGPRLAPLARKRAAKAAALKKKARYLSDLADATSHAIADRNRRLAAVERSVKSWQREPEGFLDPQEKGRLFEEPERQGEAAERSIQETRRMIRIITSFSDTDAYSRYLDGGLPFLAYDAFVFHGEEKAPAEAYVRSVLPEVDAHRQQLDNEALGAPYFRHCLERALSDQEAEASPFLEEAPPDEDELLDCLDPETLDQVDHQDEPGPVWDDEVGFDDEAPDLEP